MWNLINTWLTKLNNSLNTISHYFFTYQNQWLNLGLLTIILLFLSHLLYLIDFLFKFFYHIIKFIYYLGKYLFIIIKENF
ncbi:hypothetical protein HGD80_03520 [Paulownia witches'-broom phytoplasma]|uniref:Spiroplasmavirus-related protein n=1 Tax=Paulownia witches'-broom phytoplasma TaxID=39647 RepID=A0ABX8TPF0_9MOLU|nr:hypothetical protein [Paulownia witches'-broom phytoplasma]QYC30837.1 hypothetical protein HGD80_03520 [Paulownia witches'-broom phytoplasma]GLH60540.1 hypothetical protein PAWBP_2780 [Paulownia witches'-broom phytoplasma]GLH60920.1 hypothetical protein PAWBP_6580 [Paulownia witches'-broom phytoplasma]